MNIFDDIKLGLQQAIEIEKGNLSGRKTTMSFCPVVQFTSEEIKEIRNSLCLSQSAFALLMGVSQKTVEAWEYGKNVPSGTANRLLFLIKEDKTLLQKIGLIKID